MNFDYNENKTSLRLGFFKEENKYEDNNLKSNQILSSKTLKKANLLLKIM